jgi:hypothetical protein
MENKLPHDSDFEKFVRQSLQKTDGTPDENTWANIAARQSGRNFWLRFRHYGLYVAPLVVALVLAVGGWKYFASHSETPAKIQPEIQQPTTPSQLPQVNLKEPSSNAVFAENTEAKSVAGKSRAAHLQSKIPATRVRFAAEEGLRYENPATGTVVFIPANSLVRADGKPVRGEVEFELREYRSIPDFLTSGIPMHYADERGQYFFNSGGMFDLRVNQNGEQLHIAAGQACDVRFTSTHKLTQPSLYYFDETDNAWKYRPDPAFTTSELPPVVTEATVARNNLGLQVACLPYESIAPEGIWAQPEGDEAVAWMRDAVQTGYDYAFGKITMPGWFRKHPDWSNDQLLTGLERSAIRMKRHKDTDDMFFPEDVNNVFTELKAFKDCYFVVNDGLGGKKSFSKEDFDSYWERFSVVQEKGALCYVSFFGKQGLLQFYATLVGSTENSNFDANKVLAEYTQLRNQRQQNFEKQANTWRHFYFMAQMFQEPEEWCMDAFGWFEYFDKNLPLMRKRYAALKEQGLADDKETALQTFTNWKKRVRDIRLDNYANKRSLDKNMARAEGLSYALRVTNFGLYNCDQIFNLIRRLARDQDHTFVMAAYKSADGHRVVPKTVSVMERKTRMFFTLPDPVKMVYVPERQVDIIVMGTDGHFYRLSRNEYANLDLKNHKSHTFVVENITEKIQTPRDWADLLEI